MTKRIIELTHPGEQLNISFRARNNNSRKYIFCNNSRTTGIRFRNEEPTHKRKFLESKGLYLKNIANEKFNNKPEEDVLYFWGEWEPHSKFTLTGNSYADKFLPHAIHRPFIDNSFIIDYIKSPYAGKGCGHNTDPMVFGDDFYLSLCKQPSKAIMRDLDEGSIVLLGTEYRKPFDFFALDTVFVVDKHISANKYFSSLSSFSDDLRTVLNIEVHYKNNFNLKLYRGKKYKEDSEIFSFFPCKNGDLGKNAGRGFERPILDINKFCLQSAGAGQVCQDIYNKDSFCYSPIQGYFDEIVKTVLEQGFSLGIKTEMPPTIDLNKLLENC